MRIGFTGTRKGMTAKQKDSLLRILTEYRPSEFHHGDCLGADAEAHSITQTHCTTARVIIHPPTNPAQRAFCHGDGYRVGKEYLARNRDIVDESDMLVAAPETREEHQRSGTWATIRYARKRSMAVVVLEP